MTAPYTFNDLVENLEGRRRLGEEAPVLLLGAGASASAGLSTMRRLYEAEGIPADAADAFERFCERMRKRDDRERFRWLAAHLQQPETQPVTPGYRALAALCAEHIFDIVLTANLDPLLEDAFSATALKRRDYLVLINGVFRADRLPLLLLPGAPRVKLLKLHGDLFHRFMAWTPEEMETYLGEVTPTLTKCLTMRDVLVVGYSLRDPAVRALALGTGGTVWFANPYPPAADIADILAKARVRIITSPDCAFEALFTKLAAALRVTVPDNGKPAVPTLTSAARSRRLTRKTRRATPQSSSAGTITGIEVADNLDEVQAATLGIVVGGEPGHVGFTGFLLAEPRVIVTDAWVAEQSFASCSDPTLRVVTQSGESYRVRRRARVEGNAFGPVILEAPAGLRTPGLALNPSPLSAGAPIYVAVGTNVRRAILEGALSVRDALAQKLIDPATAAELKQALARRKKPKRAEEAEWRRFAIGQGRVHSGIIESLPIAPIGRVDEMVRLELSVGPGSSGAAVVDADCRVRGFIVAGSMDPKRPESYALPASWWASRLPKD